MHIHVIQPWEGHPVLVFRVKRWRNIYKYFNFIFAKAAHKREMIIDDGSITDRFK